MKSDTAIVLGATGAIGTQLVTQLSQRDDVTNIILISRREVDVLLSFPEAIISKIKNHVVDFEQLEQHSKPLIPTNSVAFIALGTTQKQAGSKAAFRHIDHDLVFAFARACKSAVVNRLGVVTAHGANLRSVSFYNRVKGEVERDIQSLGLTSVFFARPSLLLGRPDDGRFAEKLADGLLGPIASFLPKSIRPISTKCVAAAMIDVAYNEFKSDSFVLSNAEMHQRNVKY
ncbi:nucleoside-diphosphate sugar epimerase [Methylophaga sp. SB9B]|uniref:NAD(P)H-binding protein n=1 Tax=Methylophaga sp. SB9B TaxID=2570356 RepID=UPI0010A7A724|nr:NAD(P)H-binding protein [Methylophaga sp. SB9B]THK40557.1 nucleoside-diphosphate sugar epimerase [Methylophaga sp. SB9B]